jgi:tRNA dimethylallyltransferase
MKQTLLPELKYLIAGVKTGRETRRRRISERLQKRFDAGMIDEVRRLIDCGVSEESLIYYGLEYKYITLYLTGKLDYDTMFRELEIAIHQFAKRQMTWFRGMERKGIVINWIDGELPMDEKVRSVLALLEV